MSDYESMKQQAEAWKLVTEAFDEAMPKWWRLKDSGVKSAVTAIKVLAEQAARQGDGEAVAWLKFRSYRIAADDVVEGLEICDQGEIGDDGSPAFPVYTHPPAPAQGVPEGLDHWVKCQQDGSILGYDQAGKKWRILRYADAHRFNENSRPLGPQFNLLSTTTTGNGWVRCEDRLPTEADADDNGEVWAYDKVMSQHKYAVTRWKWSSVSEISDLTHWMPTGLKRPEPPKGGKADET